MNPTQQRQQFDTAFKGLTPEEQKTYTVANPNINVGGQNYSFGIGVASPDVLGATPITTDVLSGNNQPFKISPQPVNSSATGFGAELTSLSNAGVAEQDKADALLAKQTAETTKAETDASTWRDKLANFIGTTKGEKQLTGEAYSTPNEIGTTVDQTSRKLREINNKINAIDIRANEEAQFVQKNSVGQTESGVAGSLREINRNATLGKADLYIDKLMAQGDYDSAKAIADRKVGVQLEKDKQEYDQLLLMYNDNKEQFTKAEQRQFELMADDRKRQLDKKEADAKAFETTKIDLQKNLAEQKAPASVQSAVNQVVSDYKAGRITATEAQSRMIQAAGQYGGDMLAKQIKEAQLEALNIKNKQDKEVLSVSEAKSLGVPYGTTKAQAIALGKVPGATTLTAAQSTALGYANRTVEADKIISDLGSKFTGLGSYLPTASIFGVNIVPNALKSDDRQMFEQAQRNFVNSVLRRESGAAISPSEFENAALQYFPQPGDSEAVVKQKAANRQTTIDGLLISAGQPIVKNLANTATQTDIDYVKSLNLK